MANDFDTLRNNRQLLYEYIRGSQLYNLNTKDSDIDTGGVFICSPKEFLSMHDIPKQIHSLKHDDVWFEIGEMANLIAHNSNPTMLEALFVPKDKIIGDVHPFMQLFLDNRDAFVSKECFKPFYGYALSQIEKARGLNKKIVNPITEHKTPFHFMATFHKQGSTRIKDWLANHGLKQEYCGLVNIPMMHDMYGLFYDWGAHIQNEKVIEGGLWKDETTFTHSIQKYFSQKRGENVSIRFLIDMYEEGVLAPLGYNGIVGKDEVDYQPRLSSIANANDIPLCHLYYNKDGYNVHCKKWREQKLWEKERNPKRYESNLNKTYDSKNMMHCFRMIHMAKEIARGEGVILERTYDREFLLDVRQHKYEYDELLQMLTEEKDEMNALMKNSTIQDHVDREYVDSLVTKVRFEYLKNFFNTL